MARLYSDLLHSSGRRYYFDLNSTPGIVTPGVSVLSFVGQIPIPVERIEAFRNPATAVITLVGLALESPGDLRPAQTTMSVSGLSPSLLTSLTITPSLAAPIENPEADFVPTLILQMLVSPAPAALVLASLEINVTQGGNIGFVTPDVGSLSILGYPYVYLNSPDVGAISVIGLTPELVTTEIVFPEVGLMATAGNAPSLSLPFHWVDDEPAPSTAWIAD